MIVLVRACASVCMCIALTFFPPVSPLTQSSSGVFLKYTAQTLTHVHASTSIETHTHTVINVHPGRNIFICAAASMTIIACFCCIIITRVL